ncbi:hypothetical protein OIU91_19655 [Streptomyces sp. NBC_01456]|uniref:hypothetical protein n=1 Tax=unclassified Streptomyces TaxID=2593676 RepID=UPI002E3484C2|nr:MULTISPECIES: hypothetical protein [unclassified Streptomyces]
MRTIAAAASAPPAAPADSVTQLRNVRRLVEKEFAADQPLTRAALHLIDCATDVVARLPEGDLDAAREALGSARAAVVSATYAVGSVHSRTQLARKSALTAPEAGQA